MADLKQGEHLEPTYSSSVRIRHIVRSTCQKKWTIVKSGERGSGISSLVARQDDDDGDDPNPDSTDFVLKKINPTAWLRDNIWFYLYHSFMYSMPRELYICLMPRKITRMCGTSCMKWSLTPSLQTPIITRVLTKVIFTCFTGFLKINLTHLYDHDLLLRQVP